MTESSGNKFISSILKFSIASWASALIAFVSVPIITRAFTPEEFGKINMFNLSVNVSTIFIGLSLDQSYFRFFKEKATANSRQAMLSNLFAIIGLNFILFEIINIIWGRPLSIYLFGEMNFWIIYIALPIVVLMTIILLYQSIYFRMNENAVAYGILSVLGVFSNKVLMVFAALNKPTYTTGIILTTIGITTLVIGCKIIYPESFNIKFQKLKIEELSPFLKYSSPLLPVALIVFLNNAVTRILLKDHFSYETLGIYSAVTSITGMLSLVQAGFSTYWTPFIYKNYDKEIELIKKIHSVIGFVMILFSIILMVVSDPLFLILGEKYRLGEPIFGILLISPVVYTISETTSYGIYVSKKTHLQLYSITLSFIISTVLGFFIIPRWGILGAALMNATGGIIFFLSRTYFGLKEYRSTDKINRTIIAIAILVAASLISFGISASDSVIRNIFLITLLALVIVLYKDVLLESNLVIKRLFRTTPHNTNKDS